MNAKLHGTHPGVPVAIAFVVLLGALAGCLVDKDEPGPLDDEMAPDAHNMDGIEDRIGDDFPQVDGGNWSRLFADYSGEPGTWIMAYQPLPDPDDTYSWSYSYRATARSPTNESFGLFHMQPHAAIDTGDGIDLGRTMFRGGDLIFKEEGEQEVMQGSGSVAGSCSQCTFTGVIFAFGSTGEWTLEVDIQRDAPGGGTRPSYVSNGTGSWFHKGAEREHGLPDGPAGSLRYKWEVGTPGWTHLEILYAPVLATGVRDYDVEFPNGFAHQGIGARRGSCATGMSYGGEADFLGTPNGTTGTLRAEIAHASTDLRFDLGMFHFPGTIELPRLLVQDGYTGIGEWCQFPPQIPEPTIAHWVDANGDAGLFHQS